MSKAVQKARVSEDAYLTIKMFLQDYTAYLTLYSE